MADIIDGWCQGECNGVELLLYYVNAAAWDFFRRQRGLINVFFPTVSKTQMIKTNEY